MTLKIRPRPTPRSTIVGVAGAAALAIAALPGIGGVGVRPAVAQTVCMTHAEMAQRLDKRHSEATVAIGLASNGQLLEVYTTENGSTWTIVVTSPEGTSCVIATGESWDGRKIIALGQAA